jgi:hypothetical protein
MKTTPTLTSIFALQVIAAASTGCANMKPGTIAGSRKLCGTAFWKPLQKPLQIEAGHILCEATKQGLLPLVDRGRSPSNHRRYERM